MTRSNVVIGARGPGAQNPTTPWTSSMVTLKEKNMAQGGTLRVRIAPFVHICIPENPDHRVTAGPLQSSRGRENRSRKPRREMAKGQVQVGKPTAPLR